MEGKRKKKKFVPLIDKTTPRVRLCDDVRLEPPSRFHCIHRND